jgi:hypothetical protein
MRFRCLLLLLIACGGFGRGHALTIDFEGLPFPTHTTHYNGDDLAGGVEIAGVTFNNHFTDYGGGCCWEGFAYSRETEVPPIDTSSALWNHQYVAWPGVGSHGTSNYVVVFSGIDAGEGGLVPQIALPAGALPQSIDVTNIAYAALSVRNGDGFGKKFGGESGTDPDWFRMDIVGLDDAGDELARVPFYLADYRGEEDSIVDAWQTLDLTSLALPGIASLTFRFDSSDRTGTYLNTPAYAALDNLVLSLPLTGDYNGDGRVDAADYTVWRNTLNSTDNLAADGNNSGQVDTDDYLVWKQAYASRSVVLAAPASIPEPAWAMSLFALCLVFPAVRRLLRA